MTVQSSRDRSVRETVKYVVATDVGGTCTDAVIFVDGKSVEIGKALSTPPDFAAGIMQSIANAAQRCGVEVPSLLADTKLFVHASTVVDNVILTASGAAVGLITTRGFEDTLSMTRGAYGRWSGLSEDGIRNPVGTERGRPLVDRDWVAGISERIDYKGAVVTEADSRDIEAAIRYLVDGKGATALAVSLLWSIRNPVHERRVRDLVRRIYPKLYVTLSSDAAPNPGEYERTSTTVINAYAGPMAESYLGSLRTLLRASGYAGQIMVMEGYGGIVPAEQAADRPVGMIECGPAAGIIGSRFLGELLGTPNIIAADMGGTTFKVGVIQEGEIDYAREPMIGRYHYVAPKIHIASIGAGGGSIVWLDPHTGAPRIGPQSAGAVPGPVCYGRGGVQPTLTDVMLFIGYMDPARFLGGAVKLDVNAAREVFARTIAVPLGLTVEAAAIGIYRIATAHFGDLLREITVERGLDARDFVLHAYGGNCPMLCGSLASDLGIRNVLVPSTAPVNCAFGLVTADLAHEFGVTRALTPPFVPDEIEAIFAPMMKTALKQLEAEGFGPERVVLRRSIDMHYAGQVHEVTTVLRDRRPLTDATVAEVVSDFEALYERRYGKGSAYREAGIEMTMFRLNARGLMPRPTMQKFGLGKSNAGTAKVGTRSVFVEAAGTLIDAPIYDLDAMKPGHTVVGPAVLHSAITTIVVQAHHIGRVDEYGNFSIEIR